ncbi:MAG: type II toxin-antitoxin system VapC family toxin [Pyrinomonadaceae bacterium]
MKRVFADSFYWIALINPKDQWRKRALEASRNLADVSIITTDEILIELLNYFAESGEFLRQNAIKDVRAILLNQNVEIISCSHERVLEAINFYERRLDKGYSLTDCVSMLTMKNLGVREILAHDSHFEQEKFTILL